MITKDTIDAAKDTIDVAISELEHLYKTNMVLLRALGRAQDLCTVALGQFNWGASALSADAIRLLNEVPGEIDAALKLATE